MTQQRHHKRALAYWQTPEGRIEYLTLRYSTVRGERDELLAIALELEARLGIFDPRLKGHVERRAQEATQPEDGKPCAWCGVKINARVNQNQATCGEPCATRWERHQAGLRRTAERERRVA